MKRSLACWIACAALGLPPTTALAQNADAPRAEDRADFDFNWGLLGLLGLAGLAGLMRPDRSRTSDSRHAGSTAART